uniref:Reverse transcriptase zinc-binding domain-containing protein n=2 Tax=Fagus sylvatica TaxID=28930 RepID=A0A2N9F619_FAGSY
MKSALKTYQDHTTEAFVEKWKALWKLKIHERYKILIWRIANGILPTRLTMAQKVGLGDTICPFCRGCEELIDHLFFKCSVSRALWFGTSWAIQSCHLTVLNYEDILQLIIEPHVVSNTTLDMQRLREQTSIQIATTLDSIWNLRNQVVHQDYKFNILVIIKNLESRILEHFHVLEESDSIVDTPIRGMERWKPPDAGIVKLNVDAAFGNGKFTVAVVARNHQGSILKV